MGEIFSSNSHDVETGYEIKIKSQAQKKEGKEYGIYVKRQRRHTKSLGGCLFGEDSRRFFNFFG